MPRKRLTQGDLAKITGRAGYGISAITGIGKATQGITAEIRREGKVSELERRAGHESVRPPSTAIPYSGRCDVSVKVFRRRLTDPLGDCHKYHIDALRYLGLLADDSDAAIRLEDQGHEKVESNEEERVEITIDYDGIDLEGLCAHFKDGPTFPK